MIVRILESWTNRPEWKELREYAKAVPKLQAEAC